MGQTIGFDPGVGGGVHHRLGSSGGGGHIGGSDPQGDGHTTGFDTAGGETQRSVSI